jgi:hypothetical protein
MVGRTLHDWGAGDKAAGGERQSSETGNFDKILLFQFHQSVRIRSGE